MPLLACCRENNELHMRWLRLHKLVLHDMQMYIAHKAYNPSANAYGTDETAFCEGHFSAGTIAYCAVSFTY